FIGLDVIEDTMPDRAASPAQAAENNDFRKRFEAMLEQLPEKQRQTFVMRYFDELSYEEISKICGTSVGGLKANYFQAAKKLAQLLKAEQLGKK
ncbi:MAG: RNA polymerase sigma factor, partial [Bacteroidota bacterium]|nr:RNA polymerase sigma factor [Candidatus Kapabacteria bacterium]MDW8221204.1 RNA polymerase sigma factor [Bacteroidota bacterium]